ncbi:MAG: 30S ribosomal protein S7 [[Eubacterium] siraeum]
MPRRGNVPKRDVLPDPMYGSELVTRLVNNIMLDGKKGVAQKIVYGAFDIVAEKSGKGALEAFEEAMENIMPQLEVKARRVGGATYQVPMEVRPERRRTLGLRWITLYARQRNEDNEGADGSSTLWSGRACKARYTHRMAEANELPTLQVLISEAEEI